ncbi:hypothetical protein NKH18_39400 [Streptomyces sp. M10(2022)]
MRDRVPTRTQLLGQPGAGGTAGDDEKVHIRRLAQDLLRGDAADATGRAGHDDGVLHGRLLDWSADGRPVGHTTTFAARAATNQCRPCH